MITEADTCRNYILPKLYDAGWTNEQISEQKSFTDGQIFVSQALIEQATENNQKATAIIELYKAMKKEVLRQPARNTRFGRSTRSSRARFSRVPISLRNRKFPSRAPTGS